MRIPLPTDFSFRECAWFLDRGYDDCMHAVKRKAIFKTIRVDGQGLLVRITEGQGALVAEVVAGGRSDDHSEEFIRNYIISWLDLGRDMRPFYELLRKDKRLGYMCENFGGLRLIGIVDLFEALSWSIIGQQINLSFAFTLKRRLVEKYGERLDFEGETYYLFPDHTALAGATVEEFREMQFSRSKAAYLIGLAAAFAKGELSMEILKGLPDVESRRAALIALKGIGIWTANYTLMKTLREPSSIPYGDTGLLTALANHGVIEERGEVEKIERFFKKYKGWESYVVFYLWRSLAGPAVG